MFAGIFDSRFLPKHEGAGEWHPAPEWSPSAPRWQHLAVSKAACAQSGRFEEARERAARFGR
jgi:hypothetical protein